MKFAFMITICYLQNDPMFKGDGQYCKNLFFILRRLGDIWQHW